MELEFLANAQTKNVFRDGFRLLLKKLEIDEDIVNNAVIVINSILDHTFTTKSEQIEGKKMTILINYPFKSVFQFDFYETEFKEIDLKTVGLKENYVVPVENYHIPATAAKKLKNFSLRFHNDGKIAHTCFRFEL